MITKRSAIFFTLAFFITRVLSAQTPITIDPSGFGLVLLCI